MTLTETITFDDVNIIPIYSEIEHRNQCELYSNITKNIKCDFPIIAAPMDTVCENDMASTLSNFGAPAGCIHRFCSIEKQIEMINKIKITHHQNDYNPSPIIAAVGATGDYFERTTELIKTGKVKIILIDVAHGNHINVKNAIKKLKSTFSNIDIIAGNICTHEGAKNLCEWGADALRVGIGPGCFTPNMKVLTSNGLTEIKDIRVGDSVYTHTGELESVIRIFEFDRDEEIIEINGIECTKNHEFYVIHKKDYDKIKTDDDIKKYSLWIEAKDLTDEYYMVGIDRV